MEFRDRTKVYGVLLILLIFSFIMMTSFVIFSGDMYSGGGVTVETENTLVGFVFMILFIIFLCLLILGAILEIILKIKKIRA